MGRPGTSRSECPTNTKKKASLKQSRVEKAARNLPNGLIGSKCIDAVRIAGKTCNCLLDTGSQVTTVPWSFYQEHFSDQAIKPIADLLEVEGANGQSVPYKGFIELDITFPKELSETEITISTVALVVPDFHSSDLSQVLIGTNALDVLYSQYSQLRTSKHNPSSHGYRVVLKTLALRERQASSGRLGVVVWKSKAPEVLPAGQRIMLQGVVNRKASAGRWAVVEHAFASALPGGILVANCLLTVPMRAPYKLPVVLTN